MIEERERAMLAVPALTSEEERVLQGVLAALRRIRHGSVVVVVQDGRAVQIDTLEKVRLARALSKG